jgi:hypothetical protein
MAEIGYVLCALTSLACAVLLGRGYARSRTRLLFWSTLCFSWLTANNILLFVDRVIVPNMDLSLFRSATAFVGAVSLLYGLISEAS